MLQRFESVRMNLPVHACCFPLLDQNVSYAFEAALTKAGCVLRCVEEGVVLKGVAKGTSFVTLGETASVLETMTPEVSGWIPPRGTRRFCRLFHTKCLRFVCWNLIVVINSQSDYSDNVLVCSCIHGIPLNIPLCVLQLQMFVLSTCYRWHFINANNTNITRPHPIRHLPLHECRNEVYKTASRDGVCF